MESITLAFMAAVVGNLLWIGSELYQIRKELNVKPSRWNTNKNNPPNEFKHKK